MGNEGWKEGQQKIASLMLKSFGVSTSTKTLQSISNWEAVVLSVALITGYAVSTQHLYLCKKTKKQDEIELPCELCICFHSKFDPLLKVRK